MSRKTVVVTGCSSGFGRLTTLELARRGWRVFATVRKAEDQASLLAEAATFGCEENISALLCDITHDEQLVALAEQVEKGLRDEKPGEKDFPGLHALINNAGTAYAGPIELFALDDIRAQFEINVIAQVGVTQVFLPMLKAAGGTIVNVSSVSGRIATPITGIYAASKFALEAISDAWRVELQPFGVHVVVIEPTSSPTNIWKTSLRRSLDSLESHREGPYQRLLTLAERAANRSSSTGFPPQLFADTIVQILASPHPHTRYVVPRSAIRQVLLRRFLSDRMWDKLVRRMMKW